MTFEELRAALSGLEDEKATLNGKLQRIRSGEANLEELERDKAILMRAVADRIGAGLEGLTPKQRNDIYRRLDLEVLVQPEGEVELAGRLEANYLPDPEHVNMENGNLSFYVTLLSSVTSTKV